MSITARLAHETMDTHRLRTTMHTLASTAHLVEDLVFPTQITHGLILARTPREMRKLFKILKCHDVMRNLMQRVHPVLHDHGGGFGDIEQLLQLIRVEVAHLHRDIVGVENVLILLRGGTD